MSDHVEFFREKRPWSKYKDAILDYYLKPYLAKVARLNQPIVIVDCFAGAGRFEDGSFGSPLIILKHLVEARGRGTPVSAVFIEAEGPNIISLRKAVAGTSVPFEILEGDFHAHIQTLASLAAGHTTFLYVDPIAPSDLRFHDLADVYNKITHRSVETLVNFLSTGFVRRAQGLLGRVIHDDFEIDRDHREVKECDAIAGGEYWQSIVFRNDLRQRQRIDAVADHYTHELRRWFQWSLRYAIEEKYGDEQPKYHLIFGSRHPDAVELMNRAMVKARREFIGAQFVENRLFADEPANELVIPSKVDQLILATAIPGKRFAWKELRVLATIAEPAMYTDSDLNNAIKRLIKSGALKSLASGDKIEHDAPLWR